MDWTVIAVVLGCQKAVHPISNLDRRSMLLQAFSNSTRYQSAGESSLRYAA